MARTGSPAVKQPTFNLRAADKYQELQHLEIEIKNILTTNTYTTQDNDKIPIIFNWLGREGLQLVQTLNDKKKKNV